jgi:hypothetical protein
MVICWSVPGVREMDEGDIVTPVGKPVTCTATCEENPFAPVAESETGSDCPS